MNLYQIEQDLLELINTLEEQGGEFTEEQLQQLECTQANFREKLEGYCKYIKSCKSDTVQCKEEEARIKDIRKAKENKITKLENIVLQALLQFGNRQKNGVISIEYPTFKISSRSSSSIEVKEERINDFLLLIRNYIEELDVMCALNNLEAIEIEGMISAINAIYKAKWENNHKDLSEFVQFTVDDFNLLEVEIKTKLKLSDLFKDIHCQSTAKMLVDNLNSWMINDTSKDSIKSAINEKKDITIANINSKVSLQIK